MQEINSKPNFATIPNNDNSSDKFASLKSDFPLVREFYRTKLAEMDWHIYRNYLSTKKLNPHYSKQMIDYAQKFAHLGFDFELITYPDTRKKKDIMASIANLVKYIDLKEETILYEKWKTWTTTKGLSWKTHYDSKRNYQRAKEFPLDKIVDSLNKVENDNYRNFSFFQLLSGLRTFESVQAWNNHDNYCNGKIMELWFHSNDGKNKRANAVFCHPHFHDMKKEKIVKSSRSGIYKFLSSKKLGFELRFLREVNYTLNQSLDPKLADFMQGRAGTVSDKFYYLPMMEKYRKKWLKLWIKVFTN